MQVRQSRHGIHTAAVPFAMGWIIMTGCVPFCFSEAGWLCEPGADFGGEYSVHVIDRNDAPPLSLYVKHPTAPNTGKALLVAHVSSVDTNLAARVAALQWGSFLSDQGITVAAHAYEESDSAYGQFDLADTLDAIDWLNGPGSEILGIDQVYLEGTSRGGVIAYQAAFQVGSDKLAGVIADRGVSNFLLLDEDRERYLSGVLGATIQRAAQLTLDWIGVLPEQDPEPWKALSAGFNIERIQVPMLVVHGDRDGIVPIEQALDFMDRAARAGRSDIRLLVLEGWGHYTLGFAPEYRRAVIEFLVSN